MAWLKRAPELRLLTTSRRMLRLQGEHLHELQPLALPSDEGDLRCASMELFSDRAKSAEPSFSLSPETGGAVVAKLVRRLEGIPLAIELAAGQLAQATPQELLEQLEAHRLQLESPHLPAEPRHATLNAAIEGSWRLLRPWAQTAWAQLSVFRGGFTRAAAEAVLDLSAHPDAPPANDVLRALREASLLRVTDHSEQLRWDMYEAIREFGAAQLSAKAENAARAGHAAHFLEVGESWAADVPTARGLEARKRLFAEFANLRAAFDCRLEATCTRGEHWRDAARLALVLHAAAESRLPGFTEGLLRRAVAALEESMSAPPSADEANRDGPCFAWLCLRHAEVARTVADYDAADASLRKAARWLGSDKMLAAEIDCECGALAFFRGNLELAQARLERAQREAERFEATHLLARILRFRGYFAAEGCGDERKAVAHLEESARLFHRTGDEREEIASRVLVLIFRVRYRTLKSTEELRALVDRAAAEDDPWSEFSWVAWYRMVPPRSRRALGGLAGV